MNIPSAEDIFTIDSEEAFAGTALEIFRFQADECAVYKQYIDLLGINPSRITGIGEIPFLPISFFKNHSVISGGGNHERTFISSSTTGLTPSRHEVKSLALYEESFTKAFRMFYGDPQDFIILGLLPSYLEREGSSLIYMVNKLVELSGNETGGFFLNDHPALLKSIEKARSEKKRILLLGVTYALLDFAEAHPCGLNDVIIMETGGMKGRRKEMIRQEVHDILKSSFNVRAIHSEYGMTELLSQAYSKGDGLFSTPPWMKVLIRDSHDPLSHTTEPGTSGGISIIDLANIWSCSFIATSDLGRMHDNGFFEVLGRFDDADIRGCNLLV